MNAPGPFCVGCPHKVVEDVDRRPKSIGQDIVPLRRDVEPVESVEPDKTVICLDENGLPCVVRRHGRHRRRRLNQDDPRSERAEVGAGQHSALGALFIYLEEMDCASSMVAADTCQGIHSYLGPTHLHARVADPIYGRRICR